jgi:hypothetical protein
LLPSESAFAKIASIICSALVRGIVAMGLLSE